MRRLTRGTEAGSPQPSIAGRHVVLIRREMSRTIYWTPKFGPRNKLEFSAESLT